MDFIEGLTDEKVLILLGAQFTMIVGLIGLISWIFIDDNKRR